LAAALNLEERTAIWHTLLLSTRGSPSPQLFSLHTGAATLLTCQRPTFTYYIHIQVTVCWSADKNCSSAVRVAVILCALPYLHDTVTLSHCDLTDQR